MFLALCWVLSKGYKALSFTLKGKVKYPGFCPGHEKMSSKSDASSSFLSSHKRLLKV